MGISQPLSFKLKTAQEVSGNTPLLQKLSDYIPYAAFYDTETILTKNGELLQTLKIKANIKGLPAEDVTETGVYLREAIRNALKANLTTEAFGVYLHIHRNKTPLPALKESSYDFANALQQAWLKNQHTAFSYQNVCYLTILIRGEDVKLLNIEEFKKSHRQQKNRMNQEMYLQHAHNDLVQTVNAIQQDLAQYFEIEKLGIVPRDVPISSEGDITHSYFSEHLEWLQGIVNLKEVPVAVQYSDVADLLATNELIFGFDALEVKHGKERHFASLVSLKHYHELPAELFDQFLQMPIEIIVTQCFDFISAQSALEEAKDIKDVLRRSKDGYIAHASGFLSMLEANNHQVTDYIEQQTTIMIKTDHYAELDDITTELQTAIAKLGLVSVREDIKLEECFWSQLPGNFEFIRRKHSMPTLRACGLARLNYFPTGQWESKWGEPITIMPTVTRIPYLFHFHEGAVGHTLLMDFNSFPDTLGYRLIHFLTAAASKQVKKVIMFDRHGSAEMFTDAMKGQYIRMGGRQHNLALNPFAMPAIPRNQGFLAAWLAGILQIDTNDEQSRIHIKAALQQPWNEHEAVEGFSALVMRVMKQDHDLGMRLKSFMSLNAFGNTVASGMDNFTLEKDLTVVNISQECFAENSHFAVFALLIHRIILALDGEPTLIVIKDAWDVLEHPFFASRLESLLEMLTEQNAVLFVSARDADRLQKSIITNDILKHTPTKLFMPDDIASDYFADVIGLSAAEDQILLRMERQRGDLLIKHGGETIATRFKIDDSELQTILAGDAKALHGMRLG